MKNIKINGVHVLALLCFVESELLVCRSCVGDEATGMLMIMHSDM